MALEWSWTIWRAKALIASLRAFGLPLHRSKFVASSFQRQDQFGELDLQSERVAVLRRLDQKHHQEGNNGRPGIDSQLPGVAVMENRSRDGPESDDGHGSQKGQRPAGKDGRLHGEMAEPIIFDDELPENVAIGWPARIVNVPLSQTMVSRQTAVEPVCSEAN